MSVTHGVNKPPMYEFAFGNALYQEVKATVNDTEIQLAVQAAIDFLHRQSSLCGHADSQITLPSDTQSVLKDVKRTHLVFSKNDKEPVAYKGFSVTDDNTRIETEHLIHMGDEYRFSLLLNHQKHKFHVTEYPRNDFHVTAHVLQDDSLCAHAHPLPSHLSEAIRERIRNCFPIETAINNSEQCNRQSVCLKQSKTDQSVPLGQASRGESECQHGQAKSRSWDKTDTRHNVKIMSFNIWNVNSVSGDHQDYVRRIQKLAKVCRLSRSDIIGFQEVRFHTGAGSVLGPNQVSHLSTLLPDFQFVYQSAMTQERTEVEGRTVEGLAVFSRFPIIQSDYIFLYRNLSDPADCHQRICLRVGIQLPNGIMVNVFVTHLSLTHTARESSVVELWHYMEQFPDSPAVLLGDFNAEPQEKAIKYLQGQGMLGGSKTEALWDSWLMHHGNVSGQTYNSLEKDGLESRLDYIFMKKHPAITLTDVELCNDGSHGLDAASDHLPILASFSTRGPRGLYHSPGP